jgi:hypothetical protein
MLYYYDDYGWLTQQIIPDRSTDMAPPSAVPEGHQPNWSGRTWIIVPYIPSPPLPPPEPRWISNAEFVRRLHDDEWELINAEISSNPTLARLKDKLILGDPANPGYVNLDAQELSQGFDYVVALGIITAERKSALLV